MEKRALYTLLRNSWLNDPSLSIEPWQVEDYRTLPSATLFQRLQNYGITLDGKSFAAFAEECDAPEDLTELLIGEDPIAAEQQDKIFLIVFELWRRLLGEKPSASIICDELDQQISHYDRQEIVDDTPLQDAIAGFLMILQELDDNGVPPPDAFHQLLNFCANDIAGFLYDFIIEQLDNQNESYARDLLDDFAPFLHDDKWFDLLHLRLNSESPQHSKRMIDHLIAGRLPQKDLEFNLEFLTAMMETGELAKFKQVVQATIPLLTLEEDFQDLLLIAADFLHRIDQEKLEATILAILSKRKQTPLDRPLAQDDPGLLTLKQAL